MSKDLTPKELNYLQQSMNMPNIVENLKDEKGNFVYTDSQRALANKYKKLGMFGFDMLELCKGYGLFCNEFILDLLDAIEGYFNGEAVDNDLQTNIDRWYEGNCSDYEFMQYLKECAGLFE